MKKLLHFLKLAWSVSPSYLTLLVLNALTNAAKTVLNVVLPMYLIDELTTGRDIKQLVIYGGLVVLNNVGMTFLTNTFARFIKVKEKQTRIGMMKLMSDKIMNLEYSYLENPTYLDLKERAVFIINNQDAIANLIIALADLLSKGATLIGLIVILITLGPVLIVVLFIGISLMLLSYGGVSKYQTEVMQEMIPVNRRFGYYMNLAWDKEIQKDVRLYNMQDMITERIIQFSHETCDIFESMQIRLGKAIGQMAAISEGIAAFSYGYVGIRTISNVFGPQLSIGALTMYVSSAINFSTMVTSFGESAVNMMQFLSWLDPYMEFMSLAEETKVCGKTTMTNPISDSYSDTDKISLMIAKILHEELPMLENNSLLKDLVMYSLLEKMKTVQSVENVLSYIKENNAKQVHDVSFKNGEVRIKCST